MPSLVEKVTRAGFRLIEAQSPEKAGKLAFWLFCRTPRAKPQSEKERIAIARARTRMAEADLVRLVTSGGSVATHVFRPAPDKADGERVLVVHGYRSRSDHMVALAEALVARGKTVVCLDLPGHGASSGRQLHLGLAVEAIDAAWRQHGPFEAFVGHSFGGPSVMAAAAGAILHVPPRTPSRIVTIAAPSDMKPVFAWIGRRLGLGAAAQQVFEAQVLRLTGRPLSEFRADRMLRGLQIPMLVIHAEDDKEVAFSNAELMASMGPHVDLMRANRFGHRRVVSAVPVLAATAAFLNPGSSGGNPVVWPFSGAEGAAQPAPAIAKPRRLA